MRVGDFLATIEATVVPQEPAPTTITRGTRRSMPASSPSGWPAASLTAQVMLATDLVGLGQPCAHVAIDVLRPGEPEGVQHVARGVFLDAPKPGVLQAPGQHHVAV